MDQEFKIGEVVDVVDYVDDQQVYARGVIKDCWFSHTFDEVIYSVHMPDYGIAQFRGCYLRHIPDGLSANVVIIDETV